MDHKLIALLNTLLVGMSLAILLQALQAQSAPDQVPTPAFAASPTPELSGATAPTPGASSPLASSAVRLTVPAPTMSKASVLARLRELQNRQLQSVANINAMIRKKVQETALVDMRGHESKTADLKLTLITQTLEELEARRDEHLARRDFFDRLILQVDSKWNSQPLSAFLEQQLLGMALAELSDPRPVEARGTARLWKFMTYLSVASRELSDSREDFLSFIESYMNFSGVLDPKTPGEFNASRAYSNGIISTSAGRPSRDRLGDDVEKPKERTKTSSASEVGSSSSRGARPLDLHLRSSALAAPDNSTPAQE